MDYKEKVEWLGRYQASVSCQHSWKKKSRCCAARRAGDGLHERHAGRSGPNADSCRGP